MFNPFHSERAHVGFPIINRDESKMDEMVVGLTAAEVESSGYTLSFNPAIIEFDAEKDGRTLLETFAENWSVSDDVREASIVDERTEFALVRETRIMAVEEHQTTETLPKSEAENVAAESVPIAERYAHLPSSPCENVVAFAEQDVPAEPCLRCGAKGSLQCHTCNGSQQVQCSRCGGSSTINCPKCSGSGTVPDGEGGTKACRKCRKRGTIDCPECRGSGSTTCSTCGGGGTVVCSTCSGEGATATITSGELETSVTALEAVFTELVPEANVRESTTQTEIGTETTKIGFPKPGKRVPVQEESVFSLVPAVSVRYEHDGSEYELHNVGGELSAADGKYPKSRSRYLLPYVVVVLLVAFTAAGFVHFNGWPL